MPFGISWSTLWGLFGSIRRLLEDLKQRKIENEERANREQARVYEEALTEAIDKALAEGKPIKVERAGKTSGNYEKDGSDPDAFRPEHLPF